eukprot:2340404-Rhodomonas_salina.1
MKQHADSEGVQKHGCWALRNLAVNVENQVKIGAAGGIEAVVAVMKQHVKSEGVQEKGCGALWMLALNVENQVKIGAAGGIEAV